MVKFILALVKAFFSTFKSKKRKPVVTPGPAPVIEEVCEEEEIVEPKVVEKPVHQPKYLWLLDNGHGSLTKGKRSPVFDDGSQLLEYEFNRDIVNRVCDILDQEGIKYKKVVPEVEVGNILRERVKRANAVKSNLPKVFVSVHANAAPRRRNSKFASPSAKGIETWHTHNDKQSEQISAVFQRHLIEQTGFKDRKLKSRVEKQFYVLRFTKCPAILTECGFMNNKIEGQLLLTEEYRQKIARAHALAIIELEKIV